jgi:hypothetical protein
MKTKKARPLPRQALDRMILLCFAALALPLAAGACSAKGLARSAAQAAMEADYSYREEASPEARYGAYASPSRAAEEAGAGGGSAAPAEAAAVPGAELSRKLVKQAEISIRVQEPEKADAAIGALMARYGAYASAVNIRENFRHYAIRVPAASYAAFLAALEGMGRLLHRSESAEDVTLRYYDLEGRLSTKRELLKTYRSYLGRAENIEEILSVEAKIAELEDDIDGTGKELRSLANLVDYATVALEIHGPENIPSYAAPTLGERINELLGSLGEFFSTLLLVLLGIILYGIPGLLILALLYWILFGRIGLVKKLWRLAGGKKDGTLKTAGAENRKGNHPGE